MLPFMSKGDLTTDVLREPSALAARAERLRFRIEHRQGGDPERLAGMVRALLNHLPEHPITLNFRARAALPEGTLPRPSRALEPVARDWLRGDVAGALRGARAAAAEGPRARITLGDLLCHAGDDEGAERCYRVADEQLRARGLPSAALTARLGRCALRRGEPEAAWGHAAGALAMNPLWGTARVVLAEAARALGTPLLAWPPVVDLPPDDPDRPPGLSTCRAALAAPDPDRSLATLGRLEREGLLAACLWSVGLSASNAADFRDWRDREAVTLRRFWREGVVVKKIP